MRLGADQNCEVLGKEGGSSCSPKQAHVKRDWCKVIEGLKDVESLKHEYDASAMLMTCDSINTCFDITAGMLSLTPATMDELEKKFEGPKGGKATEEK